MISAKKKHTGDGIYSRQRGLNLDDAVKDSYANVSLYRDKRLAITRQSHKETKK